MQFECWNIQVKVIDASLENILPFVTEPPDKSIAFIFGWGLLFQGKISPFGNKTRDNQWQHVIKSEPISKRFFYDNKCALCQQSGFLPQSKNVGKLQEYLQPQVASSFGLCKRTLKILEAEGVIMQNLGTSAGQPVPRRDPHNRNPAAKLMCRCHLGQISPK